MLGFNRDSVINDVFNPLKITPKSYIEFTVGKLRGTGMYKFEKIIEMNVGKGPYARYIIYSQSEDAEYVLEVYQNNNQSCETYLYDMVDTIPFDEDFLMNVAGQKFITSPDGIEYERSIMPHNDGRIDGVSGSIKVYDIQSDRVEREVGIKVWDYYRTVDNMEEIFNLEMLEDNGMFRIFVGEMIEEVFYDVLQGK